MAGWTNWRVLGAIAGCVWVLTACGQGGGEVDLRFAYENHSNQAYSLRVERFLGSSGSRLGACESGTSAGLVSLPFQVKLGPGGLEQTEGADLPLLFNSGSIPPMGDAGFMLTIEADGEVRLEPLEEPINPRFLC